MRQSTKLPLGATVIQILRHSPGKGQSITLQKQILDEYCAFNQFQIVGTFIDAGVSGDNRAARKEFNRFIEMVQANPDRLADGVVFYEAARLAGRDFKMARFVDALLDLKGYILDPIIGEHNSDLSGVIIRDIEAHQNAAELEKGRQRVKHNLRALVQLKDETGSYYGIWPAIVPWGYRGVKKDIGITDTVTNKRRFKQCLEPDYDKWPVGQEIFRLKAEGYSYREIETSTGWLASLGTVNLEDKDVLASKYRYFLRNAIYKGEFHYSGLILSGYVEPMVTSDIWEAANITAWDQEAQNWKGGKAPKTGKAADVFVLAGMCECEHHKTLFYTRNPYHGAISRYYYCKSYRQGQTCPVGYIRAAEFEQIVIDHATSHYINGGFIEAVTAEINELLNNRSGLDRQIDQARSELDRISRELFNLSGFIRRMGSSLQFEEDYQRLIASQRQAEQRLRDLQSQQLPKQLSISMGQVHGVLEQLGERLRVTGEARAALRQIIDRITLKEQQATVYYRLPVGIVEQRLWGLFANDTTFGYVIQLPVSARGGK